MPAEKVTVGRSGISQHRWHHCQQSTSLSVGEPAKQLSMQPARNIVIQWCAMKRGRSKLQICERKSFKAAPQTHNNHIFFWHRTEHKSCVWPNIFGVRTACAPGVTIRSSWSFFRIYQEVNVYRFTRFRGHCFVFFCSEFCGKADPQANKKAHQSGWAQFRWEDCKFVYRYTVLTFVEDDYSF